MSIANLDVPVATKGNKEFLKGQITAPRSTYNPDEKVKDRTADAMKKFRLSYELMHKSLRELNDLSVIDATNKYQKLFNSFREPKLVDDWKSNALRPIVRNKAISIAAHATAQLIVPQVFAQNDRNEEDKGAASVMRDLMDWANEQSDYIRTFLHLVISAIINPVAILHTEYSKVYRTVRTDEGEKVILDEDLSGFRDTLVSPQELFIADLFQQKIQLQPHLFWRRIIDWNTAYAKYADNQNFVNFVRPGIQVYFDGQTGNFYDIVDTTLQSNFVEEAIYYDRYQDLELRFVNGVLLDDPDRPNPRQDKRYPFISGGYELIGDGKCFYYYPLVRKMADDAETINTLYQSIIDGKLLQLMPPVAVFGNEAFTSSIVTPGKITQMQAETKMQPINLQNPDAGFNILQKLESSVVESSVDSFQAGSVSGLAGTGRPTAFLLSRLEANAQIMYGLFAKMVGFMVKELGTLRTSDILQFLTVADVEQLEGDNDLKYRSFLLPDKMSNGKTKTRNIQFGAQPEGNTPLEQSFNVLGEEGGLNTDKEIFKVNPELFRSLKFKVVIRPEAVTPVSDATKKALNMELFNTLIQLPFIDLPQAAKDLLLSSFDSTRDDPEKYILKPQPQIPQPQGQPTQGQGGMMRKIFGTGENADRNMAANQGKVAQRI